MNHDMKGEEKMSPKEETPVFPCAPEEMDITQATQFGCLKRCKELIESKIWDVSQPDKEGCYVLHWAAINNRVDLIKYFLSVGAQVDQIGGDLLASPLHWATRSGHLESVILLIANGADPMVTDKEGLNCVMVAAAFAQTHCLAYIIAKCGYAVDLNARDLEGRTAAIWAACRTFNADPMRLLMNYGVNLQLSDSCNRNALHWSAIICSEQVSELLLSTNEMNVGQIDNEECTAVDYAERTRQTRLVRRIRAQQRRHNPALHNTNFCRSLINLFLWNEAVQRRILFSLPFVVIFVIGMILEVSMSYWLKFILISAIFSLIFQICIHTIVNFNEFTTTLPFALAVGTKFWLYSTFFYLSYPLQSPDLHIECTMWLLLAMTIYCFYKAVSTDPGFIPCNRNKDKDLLNTQIIQLSENGVGNGSYNFEDFCFTCLHRRPLRSKHCAVCQKCVAKFDHHCPWISNCVGANNWKWFIGYLFFLSLNLCWDMYGNVKYSISQMAVPAKWDGSFWGLWPVCHSLALASPWCAWCYINACLYGLSVFVLFLCQMYQAAINLTTNERLRHFKYKHFKEETSQKFANPFDNGCLQNLVDNFGVKIPYLFQPTPLDWKRVFSMKEVESYGRCRRKGSSHSPAKLPEKYV